MVIAVLLAAGAIAYAQSAGNPTKQDMQNYLNKAKDNTSQYDSKLQDLKSKNNSGGDIHTFIRLKDEIDRLESRIQTEINNITATHDRGNTVSSQIMDNLERMIDQHKQKVAELDALVARQK